MTWKCSICCSLLEANSDSSCTPCGHVFHSECLVRWLSSKRSNARTCPQCRTCVYHPIKLYPSSDVEHVPLSKEEMEKSMTEVSSLKTKIDNLNLKVANADKILHSVRLKAERELKKVHFEKMEIEKNLRTVNIKLEKMKYLEQQFVAKVTEIGFLKSEINDLNLNIANAAEILNFERMKAAKELKKAYCEKVETQKDLRMANVKLEKMKELEQQIQNLNLVLTNTTAELSFYKNTYIVLHGNQQDVEQILLDTQANLSAENILDSVKKLAIYCSILKRELSKISTENNILQNELRMFRTELIVTRQKLPK